MSETKEMLSATELLKMYNVPVSVVAFNKILMGKGVLEEAFRHSTKNPEVIKKYKRINENYLRFGENVKALTYNDENGRPVYVQETMPMWYSHEFIDLLDVVGLLPF